MTPPPPPPPLFWVRRTAVQGSNQSKGVLWMDEFLQHLRNPGMVISLQIPIKNGFPWFQSGCRILSIHSMQTQDRLGFRHLPKTRGYVPPKFSGQQETPGTNFLDVMFRRRRHLSGAHPAGTAARRLATDPRIEFSDLGLSMEDPTPPLHTMQKVRGLQTRLFEGPKSIASLPLTRKKWYQVITPNNGWSLTQF